MRTHMELKGDFWKITFDRAFVLKKFVVELGLEFPHYGKNMNNVRIICHKKNRVNLRSLRQSATDHLRTASAAFDGYY